MIRDWFRFLAMPLAIGVMVTVLILLIAYLGFRLNTTSSLPLGVYRLTEEPFERGAFATFCLEDEQFIQLAKERGYLGRGSCPGGVKPLGKKIFGLPGDIISLKDGLIAVNGSIVPLSGAKHTDSRGRELPAAANFTNTIIPDGYALMLSPHHAGGFDSRYFGLVRLSSLTLVEPVFTFTTQKEKGDHL